MHRTQLAVGAQGNGKYGISDRLLMAERYFDVGVFNGKYLARGY